MTQTQDGMLLEEAMRRIVGGILPVYGATIGEDWDLPAKGAALKLWDHKRGRCVDNARNLERNERQKAEQLAHPKYPHPVSSHSISGEVQY